METRYIVQSHRVKVLGVSSISVMNPDYSSTLVQPSIALVHRYVFGTVYGVEKLQDDSIPAKYGDKLVETVKESWTDLHRVNTKKERSNYYNGNNDSQN